MNIYVKVLLLIIYTCICHLPTYLKKKKRIVNHFDEAGKKKMLAILVSQELKCKI